MRPPIRWLLRRARLGVSVGVVALGLALRADDDAQTTAPAAAPSLVTLKMDASLDQVLDELQKQTDIAIDRSRADTIRAVKIDVQKAPFWDVLEKIAKSSDHRLAFGNSGRTIFLRGDEKITYRETPMSVDGVFRLAASRVQATFDYDQDMEASRYDLTVAVHWEPKFSAFLVEVPGGKTVTARDNTDKELTVAESQGRMAVNGGTCNLILRLTDVPRSARTIKLLEGSFNVIGASNMLEFKFAKLGSEEKSETKEGIKVRVLANFKEGGDLWEAKVQLEYPEGGPKMESFESGAWLSQNAAFLRSTDNKRRMDVNGGMNYEMQGERKAMIQYFWVAPDDGKLGKPADWELVVRTPSQLIEVPVKFRLENIVLP